MLGHGLTGSESAGDGSRTALGDGEHGIDDSLSGHQRNRCRKAVVCGSGHTDGPVLGHTQFLCAAVGKLQGDQCFVNGIVAVRNDADYVSFYIRGHHALVYDGPGLRYQCNDLTGSQMIADRSDDVCMPFFCAVQGIHADTAGNERPAGICDLFQGTLDPVKNIVQDAWGQGHGHGASGRNDLVAGTKSGSFLIYLNGGHVLIQCNDLADKLFFSDVYHFLHMEACIALQIDDGAVDTVDDSDIIQFRHLL